MAFIYSQKDAFKTMIEAATGGKNTVLYDDKGNPSIMVVIPKFKISDVIDGGANVTHPAFIVNGVEKDAIYISKYQNIVSDGRAYSLPGQDPATYVNFDQALQYCYAKGPGWHLMTNAEFAALALWCKKNGYMPRGNNNWGCDTSATHEKGVTTFIDTGKTGGRVATGSGPCAWSHDGTPDGIYDLNGNVWEWNSGMRLNNGEIQIIPDNNAAVQNADHGVNSLLWRAIMPDGSLVAPGTAGTLKWDYLASKITLATTNTPTDTSRSNTFETIATAAGITVPELLKSLALHPTGTGLGDDIAYMNNNGERLPFRGGSFITTSAAGVFALHLLSTRTYSLSAFGFRAAYVS